MQSIKLSNLVFSLEEVVGSELFIHAITQYRKGEQERMNSLE